MFWLCSILERKNESSAQITKRNKSHIIFCFFFTTYIHAWFAWKPFLWNRDLRVFFLFFFFIISFYSHCIVGRYLHFINIYIYTERSIEIWRFLITFVFFFFSVIITGKNCVNRNIDFINVLKKKKLYWCQTFLLKWKFLVFL